MLLNMNMDMNTQNILLNIETVNYKNAVCTFTGNLNTNERKLKFLAKLYILDLLCVIFLSLIQQQTLPRFHMMPTHVFGASLFIFICKIFLENNAMLLLKPHSNNFCLHLHFQRELGKLRANWRMHTSRR